MNRATTVKCLAWVTESAGSFACAASSMATLCAVANWCANILWCSGRTGGLSDRVTTLEAHVRTVTADQQPFPSELETFRVEFEALEDEGETTGATGADGADARDSCR